MNPEASALCIATHIQLWLNIVSLIPDNAKQAVADYVQIIFLPFLPIAIYLFGVAPWLKIY